jgi:acyl carrier protein
MLVKLRHHSEPLTQDGVLIRLRQRLPGPLRAAAADTLLTDLPIDSLDTVELLCLIDEEFGVRFEQRLFQELRTVGDLADVVARTVRSGDQRVV